MSERTRVEILTFEGCSNASCARELVDRLLAETSAESGLGEVEVEDADDAVRLRFLGSPTTRVDGRDVELGADERTQYVYACRVYRTPPGASGVPDEAWLRDALVSTRESSANSTRSKRA
jgi:hypothetical protein